MEIGQEMDVFQFRDRLIGDYALNNPNDADT